MTSPYERRAFVQTLGEGDGCLNVTYNFGCSQLIHFIYLLMSLSQPNKAKSELVTTHNKNDIVEKKKRLNYGAQLLGFPKENSSRKIGTLIG